MSKEKEKDALATARQFAEEMDRLAQALENAEAAVETAEGELSQARQKLSHSQAERLARDPAAPIFSNGETSPESRGFVQATLRLEEARAAVAGLRARFLAKDAELPAVATAFETYREDYNASAIEAFLDTVKDQLDQYQQAVRMRNALSRALGVDVPLPAVETAWHGDAEAEALHAAHVEPFELADRLLGFERDGFARAKVATSHRTTKPPFDATARFEFTRPATMVAGKEYRAGDRVDQHKIPVALLQKLWAVNYVRQLEPADQWAQ